MKRLTKIGAAAALALSMTMLAPLAASANDTSTVDYAEFDAAKLGQTTSQIRDNFDSAGSTWYQSSYVVSKEYRKAYGDQGADVMVDFSKVSGVWRVSSKSAYWTFEPNQAHNPATRTEYSAIKPGMTIAKVRSIIGSNGTRSTDYVSKYVSTRDYIWPASTSKWGEVTIEFTPNNGTFVVKSKTAYWG